MKEQQLLTSFKNTDNYRYIPHLTLSKYRWPRLVSSQTQVIGPRRAALNLKCQVDQKIVDAHSTDESPNQVFVVMFFLT